MPSQRENKSHRWTAAALSFGPFIGLIIGLLIAREAFDLPVSDFDMWFESFRQSEFSILIIIASFIGGSFLGLPQWALFAGVIAVFGPVHGGVLSWISTLISGSINFAFGRWFGQNRLEKALTAKGRLAQFIDRLRANGFLASFAVRFVPTGPFIVVNVLAGASGLRYFAFIAGTALGIIPKILIVALLAQGVLGEENRLGASLFFMGAACFLIMLVWIIRRKLQLKTAQPKVDKV